MIKKENIKSNKDKKMEDLKNYKIVFNDAKEKFKTTKNRKVELLF